MIPFALLLGALPFNLQVRPVAVLEAQLEAQATELEGENGFALARARGGLAVRVGDWLYGTLVFETAVERPTILDAYLTLRPISMFEISGGLQKSPLFVSGRDGPIDVQPISERSSFVRAFFPNREVGAEVHLLPEVWPIELWARASNGTNSPLGNDLRSGYAFDVRLDVAFGRAAGPSETYGLRVGVAGRYEDASDKLGLGGSTATGFVYYRAPVVNGPRYLAEAHVLAFAGPIRFLAEGGIAREDRSVDDDGNPSTPRKLLDLVDSVGGQAEVAWMITGEERREGRFVETASTAAWYEPAVEVAVRVERARFGLSANDVAPGGARGVSIAANLWSAGMLGLSAQLHLLDYQHPPIETPDRSLGVVGFLRLSLSLR